MTSREEADALLSKAAMYSLSLVEFLQLQIDNGQTIPELTLDDCKELALVNKFSLDQICEAFNAAPPPEGWHY